MRQHDSWKASFLYAHIHDLTNRDLLLVWPNSPTPRMFLFIYLKKYICESSCKIMFECVLDNLFKLLSSNWHSIFTPYVTTTSNLKFSYKLKKAPCPIKLLILTFSNNSCIKQATRKWSLISPLKCFLYRGGV